MSVQGWAALPAVCRPGQGHEQRRPGDFGASCQEQEILKRKMILIFAAPPSNTKALQPWQKVSEQAKKIMPWKLISMELLLINVLKTNFHRRPKTQDSRSSKHRQVAGGKASQWVLGFITKHGDVERPWCEIERRHRNVTFWNSEKLFGS